MKNHRLTSRDDVIAAYEKALSAWRSGKLDTARTMAESIRKSVTEFPKLTLLEAFIARDKEEYLTELEILKRCLSESDRAGTDSQGFAAEVLSMMGSAYHTLGEPEKAIDVFSQAADIEPRPPQKLVEASNAIFAANGAANYTAEDFQILFSRYNALLSSVVPFPKKHFSHDRLRIGYLSADFCSHPVGKLILPLLEHHNKHKFEIYCYSAGSTDDATTKMIRASADIWRNISRLPNENTAQLIRDDEIDILVELGVHTKNNRLPVLAYHPASIQICGIGDVRSSGLSCVEYFLSDIWCAGDDISLREDFSERVIALPHTHFCYTLPESLPNPQIPPCLSQDFITFGSFNNASKLTDETLKLWLQLLNRVPRSRLLLKHKLFNAKEGLAYFQERLTRLGYDISRVGLRGFSENHLTEYRDMDIALDTYPYTGGMTTFEAISMGVPVISHYGKRHGTRFGLSILQNLGLGELAASTKERYVEIAAALAEDRDFLAVLRGKLRGILMNSPLADGAQYALDMEKAYETVWEEFLMEEKNENHCNCH